MTENEAILSGISGGDYNNSNVVHMCWASRIYESNGVAKKLSNDEFYKR